MKAVVGTVTMILGFFPEDCRGLWAFYRELRWSYQFMRRAQGAGEGRRPKVVYMDPNEKDQTPTRSELRTINTTRSRPELAYELTGLSSLPNNDPMRRGIPPGHHQHVRHPLMRSSASAADFRPDANSHPTYVDDNYMYAIPDCSTLVFLGLRMYILLF